jgi:hypothetical protein
VQTQIVPVIAPPADGLSARNGQLRRGAVSPPHAVAAQH